MKTFAIANCQYIEVRIRVHVPEGELTIGHQGEKMDFAAKSGTRSGQIATVE